MMRFHTMTLRLLPAGLEALRPAVRSALLPVLHPSVLPALLPPVLAGLLLALLLAVPPAQAATIYVDATATGAGDGSSWTDAYADLQGALGQAVEGDEIWVEAGTYMPTAGTDRAATFQLLDGVALYGGFNGTETDRNQRDWTANVTVLSGDIGVPGPTILAGLLRLVTGHEDAHQHKTHYRDWFAALPSLLRQGPARQPGLDNVYHVVTATATGPTAILDGFTVTAGCACEFATSYVGAGMYSDNGSPTITNVVFTENFAEQRGGGIYLTNSSSMLQNVTVDGNAAGGGFGAGIYSRDSSPALTNVTLSRNGAAQSGGGMYSSGGIPTLTHVMISDNGVDDYGGGFVGSGALVDVTFARNVAGDGGGGMVGGGSLTNVRFSSNRTFSSVGSGGGFFGDGVLTDVSFTMNDARYGGGMYSTGGSGRLTNVTFVENHASFGAGMYNGPLPYPPYTGPTVSGPTLANVTFSGNQASWEGGGLYNMAMAPTLVNTVLWGDSAPAGAEQEIANSASVPMISYSLIAGCGGSGAGWTAAMGTDGGANVDRNPLFADAAGGDVHLTVGSPAVNEGNSAALPVSIVTDLDGNPRIYGPAVDMGAYELQVPTTADSPFDRSLPAGVALRRAVPNPFNPSTRIEFQLGRAEPVELSIYDFTGRRVRRLGLGTRGPGAGSADWNGCDDLGRRVASGAYIVELVTPSQRDRIHVALVK
jgi:predicted outer membrane repeat protein